MLDWLNDIPIAIPGVPNMTWAAWIWFGGFAVGLLGFGRVLRHTWRAVTRSRPSKAEPRTAGFWMALCVLVGQLDSLLVSVAGIVVGISGVFQPHQTMTLTRLASVGLLALLAIPVLKAIGGQAAVWFHDRALALLPKENP